MTCLGFLLTLLSLRLIPVLARIVSRLASGDVVTTPKNTVDKVVTEFGVAELRGRSIRERTRALIGIAHPDHRAALTEQAEQMAYI